MEVHSDIARLWLEEDGRSLEILEEELDLRIILRINDLMHIEDANIQPLPGEDALNIIKDNEDSVYTTRFLNYLTPKDKLW